MGEADITSFPMSILPFFLANRITVLFRAAAYSAKKIPISQCPLRLEWP